VSLLLSAVYISFQAFAKSGGGIGSDVTLNGSGTGCSCHCTSSSSSTTVTISTSATSFTVGQTYTFTVSVANSGKSSGGVMVSASNGTLTAGSDGLQKPSGQNYLVHSAPKSLSATWTFTFTPTNTGTATLYATGNAVNDDGTNGSGNCTDQWNNASNYTMTVQAASTKNIAVGRTTINLGQVRVGTRKADSVKISATGTSNVTVSSTSMKTGSYFSRFPTTTNRTINAGSFEVDSVIVQPTSRGQISDSLIVNSDASDSRKAVYVVAQGIQGILNGSATVSFANQRVNTSKTMGYVINNTGDDTLFLNNATISGAGFSIVSQPTKMSLAPNEKDSVIIQFTPTAKQTFNGTLTTSAKDLPTQNITLSGLGVAPTVTVPAVTSIGSIRVSQTTQGGVTISNKGDDTLHVTNIALTGGATNRFSVVGPTSFNLAPNAQKIVVFSYTSSVADAADSAKVTITSDDPVDPSKIVTIYGSGTIPKMRLSSVDTLSFGDVKVGKSIDASFRLDNIGSDALLVNGLVVSPSQFTVSNKPYSVQAGGSAYVFLTFTPTATGPVTGMAIITGDDPANPADTLYLKGTGTNSALSVPASLDFKEIAVGNTMDSAIVLTNSGSAPVSIFKYKLTTSIPAYFHLTDTTKHSIPANDSIKVRIAFNPQAANDFTATLEITTDDASAPVRTVNLAGRGIKGQLVLNIDGVTGNEVNFGTVDTNKTVTQRMVIHNTGTAPSVIKSAKLDGSTTFTLDQAISEKTIQAGDSLVLVVSFTPLNDLAQVGYLTITPDAGAPFVVTLRGLGKVQPPPVDWVRPTSAAAGWSLALMPNPTRSQTTVVLNTKTAADVTIALYDVAGKQVQVIESSRVLSGEHQLRINAASLPNGEYFVRAVTHGAIVAEARMIVQH